MKSAYLDPCRTVQIQLNDSLNRQLSQAAKRCGITKSAFIRVALEREFSLDRQLARECATFGLGSHPEKEPE